MKQTKAEKVIERLNSVVAAPSRVMYYPLIVKEAHGSTVTDIDGRKYIDFNAGWTVAGVGFSNPEVVAAVEEEFARSAGLPGGTFPSETTVRFAEKLVSLTPGSFEKRVWFGHSGTDACAAAYKLFPVSTKRERSVTFFGGMHGVDLAGLAMGGIMSTSRYRVPSLVSKVPYAYCYRCPYGLEYPGCGVYCASGFIEEQLFKHVCPPEDTAFMLVEAMQSDSGDVIPPREYLPKLRRTADKFGIALVADEVKIGFGRTGRMFGVDHTRVVPDAVALGKSIASGIPVGALVAREELFPQGFAYSTLVGNAVGTAAGIATIKIIERDRLPERAAKLGRQAQEEARGDEATPPPHRRRPGRRPPRRSRVREGQEDQETGQAGDSEGGLSSVGAWTPNRLRRRRRERGRTDAADGDNRRGARSWSGDTREGHHRRGEGKGPGLLGARLDRDVTPYQGL